MPYIGALDLSTIGRVSFERSGYANGAGTTLVRVNGLTKLTVIVTQNGGAVTGTATIVYCRSGKGTVTFATVPIAAIGTPVRVSYLPFVATYVGVNFSGAAGATFDVSIMASV